MFHGIITMMSQGLGVKCTTRHWCILQSRFMPRMWCTCGWTPKLVVCPHFIYPPLLFFSVASIDPQLEMRFLWDFHCFNINRSWADQRVNKWGTTPAGCWHVLSGPPALHTNAMPRDDVCARTCKLEWLVDKNNMCLCCLGNKLSSIDPPPSECSTLFWKVRWTQSNSQCPAQLGSNKRLH